MLDPKLKTSKEVERFLWSALSTARIASGGVQRLTSAVSSESLMCHRPWPIYLNFMPYSLSTSSHVSSLHTRSLLAAKKKTLGWYHSFNRYLCFSPCIASSFSFFFLSFYLNSWYARGRKRVVIILWCAGPVSSQRGRRTIIIIIIRAQGGGHAYAALCCDTLCYACSMWWPLWKCREWWEEMMISVQRRAQTECTQSSYKKKKVPRISFKVWVEFDRPPFWT